MNPNPGWLYWPNFFSPEEATDLHVRLQQEIQWEQGSLRMYGKEILFPRLMAWYGEQGRAYRFSGKTYEPLPYTELLASIQSHLHQQIKGHGQLAPFLPQQGFNSVLLNWYRHGQDSMSWHSDDEPELGPQPFIASLSLGASRWFHFRSKVYKEEKSVTQKFLLEHGSLLLMYGDSQATTQHALPKTKKVLGDRINLTFRTIF